MPTNSWNPSATSFAAPVQVFSQGTIPAKSGYTDPIDVQGYTWIDWLVYYDQGSAGVTLFTAIPYTLFTGFAVAPPGAGRVGVPYEPAVAGTGTTVVYNYTFTEAVSPAPATGSLSFRTPVVGRQMQLFMSVNGAETLRLEVFALPRT